MRKHGLGKMPTWQRWLTISSLIICSISGIAFLMGHEFQISRQTLGNHSVLALHGIASALALIAFGTILPFHIKVGLKAWKNLISGVSQLLFLAILVITALLLYYGPEELHDASKLVHWALGLVFFIIFIFHISNRSIRD
jgi:purine-cytosine permease-like protein